MPHAQTVCISVQQGFAGTAARSEQRNTSTNARSAMPHEPLKDKKHLTVAIYFARACVHPLCICVPVAAAGPQGWPARLQVGLHAGSAE
jgi:hypothetical protein